MVLHQFLAGGAVAFGENCRTFSDDRLRMLRKVAQSAHNHAELLDPWNCRCPEKFLTRIPAAPGNPEGTVVNALIGRYPAMAEDFSGDDALRPGIIHRLDKDTSGCLAVAKTVEAKFKLGKAFADRKTGKTYLAICRGIPKQISGELKNLIGRHPVNRQKMAIVERNGKNAISEYEVIDEGLIGKVKTALVKVRIYTGRTHQIRVHLAGLGCPVLGDELYGGAKVCSGVPRQMLHAWKLKVPHPLTGEMIKVQAPIPEDIESFYRLMKKGC
jgi:23S rRNA pseudouridine1911/1915/1917 synthase